jgi:UPF0042 nucleotide-binding protein
MTPAMDQGMTAEPDHRLIFVTGPSGAGRTTAIRVLEDLGFEGIDNIPLSLVPRLIDGAPLGRPIALGLDVRNRDFNATALIELIDRLTRDPRVALEVLYLDCAPGVLIRRFSETRRRHPLAPNETAAQGVEREIDLLAPIRVRADHLIDTTELTQHELKAELATIFDATPSGRLSVSVQSFSYKRGIPRGVDMIFDCRFLANPHWRADLRPLDGRDPLVESFVRADPRFAEFFQKLRDLLLFLLPAQIDEGKAHVAIGFGCTGGQHRSVAVAEMVGSALAEAGWPVSKRHRELERRGAVAQSDAIKVAGA